MVAVAAVAAFDAVGSIIVIAMFVCPAAAARMMTDRLSVQIAWSIAFAILAAALGYVLAGYGPLYRRAAAPRLEDRDGFAGAILARCAFGAEAPGLKASARSRYRPPSSSSSSPKSSGSSKKSDAMTRRDLRTTTRAPTGTRL